MLQEEFFLPDDLVILSTADLAGNIIDYNHAFREVSGYSDDELRGKSHSILRHPDMPKEAFQDLWASIQAGKPWFGVVKNRRKNGGYYWVTANVTPIIESGNVVGYLSVRYPASRTQIMSAGILYADIQAGMTRYPATLPTSSLLNLVGIGMAATLATLPVIVVGMSELPWSLGLMYGVGSLLGVGYLAYRSARQDKPSAELIEAVERIANGQFREPIKDTSYWGFALNMIRARLGEASARLYDTAVKEAQVKFAMESAQAQTRFLISMSHELRTPLNGMIATSQLLFQELSYKPHRDQAQMLYVSTTQLSGLIYNLLDYANLENNQLALRSREFKVQTWLCSDVLMTHLQTAKNKGLGYRLEIEGGVPEMLKGDQDRLAQILNNIIGNAMKFTERGEVVVRLANTVAHHPPMVELKMTVSDTGCGLSQNEIGNLFKPFSQVDHVGKKANCGTGLGLVVTDRLVKMMQGDIKVRSQLGQGSVFEVRVLLSQVGEYVLPTLHRNLHQLTDQHCGLMVERKEGIPNIRVAVIEDNFINQAVIINLLNKLGITLVDIFNNGQEFLSFVNKHQSAFDLVLMDCLMPVMDGYEATRQWRNMEQAQKKKRLPIIALTANAVLGDEEACYASGMDDYLTKPVNIETLKACLLRWHPKSPRTQA